MQTTLQLPPGDHGRAARLLVAGGQIATAIEGGWAIFTVASVTDHEVVVLE